MKKAIVLSVCAVIVLFFASCSSCSNKRTDEDAMRKAAPAVPDSTIYSRLNKVVGDSIDVSILEDGKKLRLSVAEAKHKGKVAGDLIVGDTLAIMARDNDHEVTTSVNVSQLKGLWFFEGKNGDGMRINNDGAACSIGAEQYTLKTWRIGNGYFILGYIKADGSDYTEMPDTSEIYELSKDKLIFVFKDRTVKCTRSVGLLRAK